MTDSRIIDALESFNEQVRQKSSGGGLGHNRVTSLANRALAAYDTEIDFRSGGNGAAEY